MNAVEIEQAISELAQAPFDASEFPFSFLAAFGNKDTTLKRLRTGNNNASDIPAGVLLRNNIHIAVCAAGGVGDTLKKLRASPATTKARAKFILATDGQALEAEELAGSETIACAYPDFPNHFGFFLPLAGISTIKEIKDNPIDVRATGRLKQVPILWPSIFQTNSQIVFARTSFKWANLASYNAGVTVVIIGISRTIGITKRLYSCDGRTSERKEVANINAYLTPGPNIEIQQAAKPLQGLSPMQFGNHPYYGAALIFSMDDARQMIQFAPNSARYIRPFYGSKEFIDCAPRACLWISDAQAESAKTIPQIAEKIKTVRQSRNAAVKDASAQKLASTPWRFREQLTAEQRTLIVPRVSSENRPYLPVGLLEPHCVVQEKAFALYDAPLWNMALIASRLHWVWIGAVCVRLEMRFSYSNTLGWNTFPVPFLTTHNKEDLTACAENILLAREAHFPATIADLYDPENMPENLRAAHAHNDEVLERIYIGRRFKNDTERLEKLFEMYSQMTAVMPKTKKGKKL